MITIPEDEDQNESEHVVDESSSNKEYQTLFWVPMLFQTAKSAESLIEDMLELIGDFHLTENSAPKTHSDRKQSTIIKKAPGQHKRRQQILGEKLDSEVVTTRVDVVLKSENSKYNLLSVLKQHFLFSQLRDYELEDVIDVMQALYVGEDEIIIQEGDAGELFYILEEGRCEALIGDMKVKDYDAGSAFGDLALMYNSPRAATIRSTEECTLWTLDRVFFRQAMVTSSSNQNVQLSQFLSKIPLFETIGVQKLNQLARSLTKQTYDDGQYIIKQGDIGNQFYVLHKGQVRVTQTDDRGKETQLIILNKAGDMFGERALIRKEPRKANIIAEGQVECYYLEAHDFYSMLGEFVDKFGKLNEFRILRSSKVLAQLSDSKIKEITPKLQFHRMFSGQRVVCGHQEVYIVIDGEFQANNTGTKFNSDNINIGSLEVTADAIAGALTLLSDEGVMCSITKDLVETAIAEDALEQRNHSSFIRVGEGGSHGSMLTVDGTMDTEREIQVTTARRHATAKARRQSLASYMCDSLEGLDLVQPLGKGTFGSVFLCKRRGLDGHYVALKCLDKKALVDSGQHHYVRREIIALSNFQHPFLSEYYGVVLTPRKIFFVLEFINGGELWSYLYENSGRKKGPFEGCEMTEATYYTATVLLALEHIHGLGYSYRDLKPENLLISKNGYLKLVDFGFAKQVPFLSKAGAVQYRTFTLCGTPDYMAPELVLTQGHDKSADYWAYGVLMYEIICRSTPFESANQQRTFEKIVHSQKHLSFPPDFNPHCKSLIRRLLHPNAALRLGALQNGIDDIKNHAFFTMQGVNFSDVLEQKIPMTYIPAPYDPNKSKPISSHMNIDSMDLEFERSVQLDDDYDGYFDSLINPDLVDEN